MAKSSKKRADARAALLEQITPAAAAANEDGLLPDIPEWAEAFPALNAMMTVCEFDGKPRKTATVTIWVEEHGVKAVFSDRQHKRKLWAVASSIGSLWGELEAALTAKTPDWRSDAGTKWRGRS